MVLLQHEERKEVQSQAAYLPLQEVVLAVSEGNATLRQKQEVR